MPQLSICRQCDRVVYTEAEECEVPFVQLGNGETMHADCYEEWQEEIAERAKAATKPA